MSYSIMIIVGLVVGALNIELTGEIETNTIILEVTNITYGVLIGFICFRKQTRGFVQW